MADATTTATTLPAFDPNGPLPTKDQYGNWLVNNRPSGMTETQAIGNHALDAGTQSGIEQQLQSGAYKPGGSNYVADDSESLMKGVGDSKGLLGNPSTGNSMGMSTPEDFSIALAKRSQDAVANTVVGIKRQQDFTAPMRIAKHQADASASLAKTEQLRYNNWVLKNQQFLLKTQAEAAMDSAKAQALAGLLGGIGSVVGGVAGGVVGGPAGAAAGAAGGGVLGGAIANGAK